MKCTWIFGVAIACGCGPVVGEAQSDASTTGVQDGASEGVTESGSDSVGATDGGDETTSGELPSGQLIWSDRYDVEFAGYGHAVALGADGSVWLGVSVIDADSRQSALVRAYTAEGGLRWQVQAARTDQLQQSVRALAVDDAGTATVAVAATTEDTRAIAELVQWDGNGTELWSTRRTLAGGTSDPHGLAIDGFGRLFASGAEHMPGQSPRLWLEAYDGDALRWSSATDLGGDWPGQMVATGLGGGVVSAGPSGAGQPPRLLRFTGDGAFAWDVQSPCGRVITSDASGGVWAVGDDATGEVTICSVDASGAPGLSFSFTAAGLWVSTVAALDDGDLVLVGYLIDSPSFLYVERRSSTGELRWSFAPADDVAILPFAVAVRPGLDRLAISGVTLDDEAEPIVLVLTP